MDVAEENKEHILLVDDGAANLKIAESYLLNEGYLVTTAQTGVDALEVVDQNNDFDLILLDVMMPIMDGFEVCRRLKANPETKDIPVIFLTVLSDVDDIVNGFGIGAIDYITKPFNALELIARVRAHLEYRLSRKQLLRVNRRLMTTEQDLLCLLESVHSGILIVDPDDNKIVDINSAALSTLEQPLDQLVGTDYTSLFKTAERGNDALDNNESYCLEAKLITADGREYDVIQNVTEVDTSEKIFLLVNFIDITDRKQAELLREDIGRIIQHDLKGPLNAVIALPEIIKENNGIYGEDAKLLNLIEEAGYQMLGMINLSLNMYKMECGDYQLNSIPVDIIKVVNKIIKEQSLFLNNDLNFKIFLNNSEVEEGDTLLVCAEDLLCYSMFSNIIKNASEASEADGVIQVKISTGKKCEISTYNTGLVPDDVRESFFDKYSTSGKPNGTGLGTYSARLIAETLRGTIKMESNDTNGTIVSVELPLVEL